MPREACISKKRDGGLWIAVLLMLFSGLGFALSNLYVRLTGPVPGMQKVFYRNLLVLLFSLATLLRQRRRRSEDELRPLIRNKSEFTILILRSLLGVLGMIANYYAVDHLPLANASVLNKLSPFFTVIFSAIFLKERINIAQASGIALAFTGVIVLSRPVGMDLNAGAVFPLFIGLLGGVLAGASYTTLRYLGKCKMNGTFIIAFFAGFSCLVTAPWLIFDFYPMNGTQWFYTLLVGITALAGQYGITYAYRFAAANRISIFDYSSVLFATLLGIFVLNQLPTTSTIIGIVIIFAAFLVMYLYNRRRVDPSEAAS